MFYMQAKSYSEVQDSCVAVSISGDMGEARSFQSNQLDNSGTKCTQEHLKCGHFCFAHF